MRKVLFISMALWCVGCLLTSMAYAQEQDTTATVEQLSSELEKSGVYTSEDLRQIKRPLKDMLDKGATKRSLKRTLKDLSEKDVRGWDLRNTIYSMNDLVKTGENPKEAGNIVSSAARQAHIEGLKGKQLAAKVQEAIRQRKQERAKLKQQMKKQKQELKTETKELKEKSKQKGRR